MKVTQTLIQCQFRCWGYLWSHEQVIKNKFNCTKESYVRTGSSTSMEADIIALGFQLSDTVCNTCKSLVMEIILFFIISMQTRVQSYGRDVEKIECAIIIPSNVISQDWSDFPKIFYLSVDEVVYQINTWCTLCYIFANIQLCQI